MCVDVDKVDIKIIEATSNEILDEDNKAVFKITNSLVTNYKKFPQYLTINDSNIELWWQLSTFTINERGKWVGHVNTRHSLNFYPIWYQNISSIVSIKCELPGNFEIEI